jgi:hypothetical protein
VLGIKENYLSFINGIYTKIQEEYNLLWQKKCGKGEMNILTMGI